MTVSSDVYISMLDENVLNNVFNIQNKLFTYFPFGETKNFCSTIVTHFVVGDLCKNVK